MTRVREGARWEEWCAALLTGILVFAPLIRAGNRPIPLLLLELASLVLIYLSWGRWRWHEMPRLLRLGLVTLLAVPLLQLLPVPFSWWAALPGREMYAQALQQLGSEGWRTVSLVSSVTGAALLALLPPLAVFLAARAMDPRLLRRLVGVVLAMGVIQALLGLIQFGAGPGSWFSLGNPFAGHSAHGFHANRDHLAGMLEMILPLALALTAARVGHGGAGRSAGWRQRLSGWVDWRANQAVLYGACALALFLGLVFTRSRMGVMLGMLLILLAVLAFGRRLGGRRAAGVAGTLAVVAVALAAEIGLAPVLQRFVLVDPLQDARWSLFEGAADGIARFMPVGSGLGTLAWTYPAFQTVGLAGYVNHAHNDYLEWLYEGGLLAAVALVLLAAAYLLQWRRVWHRGEWRTFRFLQVGAGLGMLLFLLHGLVDFNFHIPANAIYFAFLAALFFHAGESEAVAPKGGGALRRMPERTPGPPAGRRLLGPAQKPVRNPLEEAP